MYGTHDLSEDRFGFSAQGTFQCSRPTERIGVFITGAATVLICFGIYYVMYMQFAWYRQNSYNPIDTVSTFGFIYVGLSSIAVIIGYAVIHYIMSGVTYRYSADGNRFSFVCEKAGVRKTDIFYEDVVSVDYTDLYLFGLVYRGFEVTVVTRSLGTLTFRYLFNKSIADKTPQNTPFYIIEERAAMVTRNAAAYGR